MVKGKRAFVLAGGGSRGAYQIGVWQALREINYTFSIVTGASVGALNGAMIVQGDFEKAKWLWEHISLEQVLDIKLPEDFHQMEEKEQVQAILKQAFFEGGAGYGALKQLLTSCLDEQAVRDSNIQLGIVTVKVPGYTPCTLFQTEIPQGKLIDYLLASSACFPAMKSYTIDGKSYIDGGYYDNLPIELAQQEGATEVFAVDVDSIGLRRKYDKKKSKVHILHPKEDLGFFLKFDASLAKRNIRYGYFDTMKYFGKLDGMRYTFSKGELHHHYQGLRQKAAYLSQKMGVYLGGKPKNTLEKLARFSAIKTLRKHCGDVLDRQAFFSCALEFSAEILGMDSNQIYTVDEMHQPLKERFQAAYRKFDHQLDLLFDAKKDQRYSLPFLKEQLANMDQKTLLCLSYSLLQKVLEDKTKRSLLWLAMCCIPKECISALYLLLCFGHNA